MPPRYYTVIGQEMIGPCVLRCEMPLNADATVEVEWPWSGIVRDVRWRDVKRWRGTVEMWFGSGSIWAKKEH